DYASGYLNKTGEELCGDTVEFYRGEKSTIAVLSDGLGSGVKANILATLTAKIAITMLKEGLPIEEVVDTIIHTLPVCNIRKLAYSTFTIVKIDKNGYVYVVEFDNPSMFYIHDGKIKPLTSSERIINERKIKESEFKLIKGDALIFVSDGVVHAGVGHKLNLGWGWLQVADYLESIVDDTISALSITNLLLKEVDDLYQGTPGDDVTVVTLKAAVEKDLVLFSGPPINKEFDCKVVKELIHSKGKKLVCGGTAANIVARETNEELHTSFNIIDPKIPPIANINGIDLVTEGVLTIKGTVEKLKKIRDFQELRFLFLEDGASKLTRMLYNDCTHIKMLIGKAINPAHQNPDFPQELSIKLNILEELIKVLKDLGKIVEVQYY
ncbi:MAG: Stage sporulation protein, partial [Haloplasmataceae bacterium]|nr:Stage sporulation protein [Haloplasmataceae bacterium]